MSRKNVAVLDVRSAEITAVVGENGVNNTFVFKGIHTQDYDGYADAEFLDLKSLQNAVYGALDAAQRSCGERIREIYVGVPGEFSKVVTKHCFMSFQNKRRVTSYDLDALFEQGLKELHETDCSLMKQSAVCYVTSDKRRSINPVGMISNSLEGNLSYFFVFRSFENLLSGILKEYGISKIYFLPTSLAEALYLIPSEKRDEYAILLDIGKLSMTFSVVCGNGIVYQSACSAGGGYVTAQMYSGDDPAEVPFEVAEAMIKKINLSSRESADSTIEYIDKMDSYVLPVNFIKERVKNGLDMLCEVVNYCLELYGDKNLDYKPILLTGGGITAIRGAREYLSVHLNKVVEVIAPKLPYYNKAAQSSLLSLLNMALETRNEKSFLQKFFRRIGG